MADWRGANASEMQNKMAGRLMGGTVAYSSRSVYATLFKKCAIRRKVLGMPEYRSASEDERGTSEAAAFAYVTPNLGPVERNATKVQNHLHAIGYFRKIRFVPNPLRGMSRLQNLTKGRWG